MQRSVIQLAGKTLVVSLPSKWCRENGVRKGGKVDLREAGSRCIIDSYESGKPSHTWRATSLTRRNAWHYLQAAYEAGITELTVELGRTIDATTVWDIVKELPGWEVTRQHATSIVIKEINTPKDDTLETLRDRIVHLLVDYAATCASVITSAAAEAKNIIARGDEPINRLTSLCQRSVSRSPGDSAQSTLVYRLEYIGDAIRSCGFAALQLSAAQAKHLLTLQEQAIREFAAAYFAGKADEHLERILVMRTEAIRAMTPKNNLSAVVLLCKLLAETLVGREFTHHS